MLDLFGCNLLGIIAGEMLLRYFSVKKIDWLGAKKLNKDAEI